MHLSPSKKPKKQKQKPAPQSAKTEPEQPTSKQPLSERIGAVLDLLRPLPACIQRLLRHTKIKKLCIQIVVAEPDAAQTAISYGRTCAVVHGALAALRNFFNMQVKSIQIQPDFTAEQGSVRVSGRIEARIGTILLCGLQYLWSYLKTILHKSHEFSQVKAKDGVQK